MDHTIMLTHLDEGKVAIIKKVNLDNHTKKRLTALGLLPSSRLKVLKIAPFKGDILVDVGGRPLAISHDVAEKISVEEVEWKEFESV
ncbi:MAG: ferrous iron transport protein A [Nitrososphaerales archaeon]|nr:ferrous iron transport protein A [Nitrososphaerales archaeon]